jgi:hypothetical protein
MLIKDLMLHLKSLVWCLASHKHRYNLRLVLDSLNARHVPESIQGTTLGQNLNYLIFELNNRGELHGLLITLQKIEKSKSSINKGTVVLELGQYIRAEVAFNGIPKGSFGVISFIDTEVFGLFYIEGKGLVERIIKMKLIKIIRGTFI